MLYRGAGSLMGGQIARTGQTKATGPWLPEYCGSPGHLTEAFRSEMGEAELPALVQTDLDSLSL